MTADYRSNALKDPTTTIEELYREHAGSSDFARVVAEHFRKLFESRQAFRKIPTLNVCSPPESYPDRALVRFRAMVQDTSLSTEMYLSKFSNGLCGGWGIEETEGGSSSSARELDYANLRECNVLWATTVPAETQWCSDELDDSPIVARSQTVPAPLPGSRWAHKYPQPESGHIGVQVKIYERERGDAFKSTDIITFVGIITTEPCGLDQEHDTTSVVPTLHVLFTKLHTSNMLSRPFPRIDADPQNQGDYVINASGDSANSRAQDTPQLRDELIAWIADEALGGDRRAAEWILFSCIARVQSRHPPLLPPPLVVSNFPPPPPVPSTRAVPTLPLPTLSTVLGLLFPLTYPLSLSLDSLNKNAFTPESKDEDLHAGVLQLPQGTVLLVSEGGVREGQLFERGVLNVRALQEVMDAQTLAYVFPFSQFSFPTDISCIILAEGRKSALFKTELSIPLTVSTDPAAVSALYKPANEVKLPPKKKLEAFRDLVVGARHGKVQVPEATSQHIEAQFVRERQGYRNVTADDLIRWMSISKLYALSLHEPTLSVETWQRAKVFDEQRRALVA